VDIAAYKLLQQSEWIREQADRLASGEAPRCPVAGCEGLLELYELEQADGDPRVGIPAAGGVVCGTCRARSRPVAL
jgi:hypothetical protein